jgi:hypothetical protein
MSFEVGRRDSLEVFEETMAEGIDEAFTGIGG